MMQIRRVTREILILSVLLGGSACFNPQTQEGLACSESEQCPSGQECIESVCRIPGGEVSTVDASSVTDAAVQIDSQPAVPDAEVCPPGSQEFAFTGAIETFTVPDCVRSLTIEAYGAQGGGGRIDPTNGGKGARMKGDFSVSGGDTIQILVGGRGVDGVDGSNSNIINEQASGTGGGGSFVVLSDNTPLLIAGGGGGTTRSTLLSLGQDASTGLNGLDGGGEDGADGGSNGAGGTTHANTGFHGGTGGGGFSGNGVNNSNGDMNSYGTPNQPGRSFLNGGAGGIGGNQGRDGGFGGGGSAGYTGGGGGGYSGGGASDINGATGAGGGGSYNSGQNQDNESGAQTADGNGRVLLSW